MSSSKKLLNAQGKPVKPKALASAIFAELEQSSEDTDLRTLRRSVEDRLGFEKDLLKSVELKQFFRDTIAQYQRKQEQEQQDTEEEEEEKEKDKGKKQTKKRKRKQPEDEGREDDSGDRDEGAVRKGKFSATESSVIMSHLREFLADNNLQAEDLVVAEGKHRKGEKALVTQMWASISSLLPNRMHKSIYNHGLRQLARESKTQWSNEEKNMLAALVRERGTQWASIGRQLGRHANDCKLMHERSTKRVKSGRFTKQEDAELLAAVLRVTGCAALDQVPTSDLPWQAISKEMGNERHDLDYLRRWHKLCSEGGSKQAVIEVINENGAEGVVKEKKMRGYKKKQTLQDKAAVVAKLKELSPNDASEVNWAAIDRELALKAGVASRFWRHFTRTASYQQDQSFLDNLSIFAEIDKFKSSSEGNADEDLETEEEEDDYVVEDDEEEESRRAKHLAKKKRRRLRKEEKKKKGTEEDK